MRVLIADDDPIQLCALESLASSWQFDVVRAANGIDAWRVLDSAGAPKLAILDAMMPGMDGFQIAAKVRQKDEPCPPYLIILSALDARDDVIKALEAGANDFVKKPADSAELRARMQVGARVVDLQEHLAQRLSDMQGVISERERTEAENLRLRSAIDQASEGVLITDCNGTIQYVNAAFTTMSGYSREQLLGRNPRVLKSGVQQKHFYEDLWRTIRAGNVWSGELTNRRANGSLYTERMTITPTRDDTGSVTNYVAFKSDVTDQKAAEADLAREQALVRTLMNNVPDAIYFKDTCGRFLRINNALARHLGLSGPTLAVGKTPQDFFSDAQRFETDNNDEQIIATRRPVIAKEEREVWPDGSVTWASTTKMPLRGPDGAILGTFGISRDITLRKQAEDALREREQKYRLQSSLLHAIYDVSPDGILVVDRTGMILSHNRRFLEIWRMDVADAVGCQDEPILRRAVAW